MYKIIIIKDSSRSKILLCYICELIPYRDYFNHLVLSPIPIQLCSSLQEQVEFL